jgi:hypothetical protein
VSLAGERIDPESSSRHCLYHSMSLPNVWEVSVEASPLLPGSGPRPPLTASPSPAGKLAILRYVLVAVYIDHTCQQTMWRRKPLCARLPSCTQRRGEDLLQLSDQGPHCQVHCGARRPSSETDDLAHKLTWFHSDYRDCPSAPAPATVAEASA